MIVESRKESKNKFIIIHIIYNFSIIQIKIL